METIKVLGGTVSFDGATLTISKFRRVKSIPVQQLGGVDHTPASRLTGQGRIAFSVPGEVASSRRQARPSGFGSAMGNIQNENEVLYAWKHRDQVAAFLASVQAATVRQPWGLPPEPGQWGGQSVSS
jgi:hypothetical protein